MLAIFETHPVQYRAPIYRHLRRCLGIPVQVIYGSDCSVSGYVDPQFGVRVKWDTDLLTGYSAEFLSTVELEGAKPRQSALANRIVAAMSRLQPHAALILGYGSIFHLAAFMAARRRQCPILFRAETGDHGSRRSWLKRQVRDALLRRFYSRCAYLLYLGRQSLRHYQRLGCPESKLIFSPYCVDAETFQTSESVSSQLRNSTRESLNIPRHSKVLLFSGKLYPLKGAQILVDSLKSARSLRERTTLVVVGDGRSRLELEANCKIEPRIDARFVGFQNQTQLSRFYHAADVLVLPSFSETWGLVVNEALIHGLPAVVSNGVGCAADLVEEGATGAIFEAGCPRALAQALERGLDLAAKETTRRNCQTKARQYSIAAAGEGIARAYLATASA